MGPKLGKLILVIWSWYLWSLLLDFWIVLHAVVWLPISLAYGGQPGFWKLKMRGWVSWAGWCRLGNEILFYFYVGFKHCQFVHLVSQKYQKAQRIEDMPFLWGHLRHPEKALRTDQRQRMVYCRLLCPLTLKFPLEDSLTKSLRKTMCKHQEPQTE